MFKLRVDIYGAMKRKAKHIGTKWQTNDNDQGQMLIWPWWIPNALIISKMYMHDRQFQ